MGQLADVVKDPELEDVSEELSMLSNLAQARLDLFKSEIESSLKSGKVTDDLTVAITKLIKKHEEYRVYTGNATELPEKISNAVQEIIGGETAEGITNIVSSLVNVFLGAEEGEETMERDYVVTVEYPAIIRLDMAFWSWKVKNEKLKTKAQSIICFVVYKSAVDVEKLDFNAFLSVYAPTLRATCIDKTTNQLMDEDKLIRLLEEAKKVYTLLKGDSKGSLPMNSSIMKSILLKD